MYRALLFLAVTVVLVAAAGWWAAAEYLQITRSHPVTQGGTQVVESLSSASPLPSDAVVAYELESVATGLRVPWSLVFTDENRVLITERPGRVRVIEEGKLRENPIRVFTEVSSDAEEGLMGMALDPEYRENKWLYLCLAYEQDGQKWDKVVRVTDTGSSLTSDTILLDRIPAANFHAGCRLRFGTDGKLYVTTGDATKKAQAQDPQSLAGKILRLNKDGSKPSDNPFPDSYIYSMGHRNPQGFDWHPVTNQMVATEHGPSGNDGPGGGDEVNLIVAGENYGWPIVSHDKSQSGLRSPLLVFTPAVAPASGMFYRGDALPQFKNTFLFGMLRGNGIVQVVFDPNDAGKVLRYEKVAGVDVGRVRDIVEGPDGFLYFTTSNQDGRGKARAGDDQLYRLRPQR